MMADVVPAPHRAGAHALANVRRLVDGAPFDQAFTPRWSPDNRHVAYSAWQRGGYRDVRIVDTQDGSLVDVTHDRAIDGDPVYSADGRWLYFHSDRTGVSNIYAYEVATGRLKQVTNVDQRRVPAGALARRQVARVRGLHARRLRRLRHRRSIRRRGSTRCPTRSLARRRPPDPAPAAVTPQGRTTRSSRCGRATTRCRSRRATSARRASSRPRAATSPASTRSRFKR